MIPATGGEGSAVPSRRRRSPRAKRKPEHRFLLRVLDDGDLRYADGTTRKKLRAAGFKRGQELIGYLYAVRDPVQWRRAHRIGTLLAENCDRFFGMQAHEVLKALQLEGNIACHDVELEVTLVDEQGKPTGTAKRTVREADSLEFGNLDEGEWQAIRRRLAHEAQKYFGELDADVVEELIRLMPEPE